MADAAPDADGAQARDQRQDAVASPEHARLESRHLRLRPVNPMDYEALYALSTRPDVTFRWRTRGSTPSPEAFANALWNDTLVNFVVETRESRAMLGLVSIDGAQFRDGFAHLTMVAEPAWFRSGIILEGAAVMINYAFDVYPFRKLYMESVAFNYEHLKGGAGRFFEVEGCLHNHAWYRDRYWDQYLLAIYRERWDVIRRQLAWALTPDSGDPGPDEPPIAEQG